MEKRSIEDASERLRQIWLAYEYPGRLVCRDIARLGRMFKRVWLTLAGRSQRSPVEDESENYLWAERRD
jgi:hypothetical protein